MNDENEGLCMDMSVADMHRKPMKLHVEANVLTYGDVVMLSLAQPNEADADVTYLGADLDLQDAIDLRDMLTDAIRHLEAMY